MFPLKLKVYIMEGDRIIQNFNADAEGMKVEDIINELLKS